MGRPFFEFENDEPSRINKELVKSSQFSVLETILNQFLDFADYKGND